MNSRRNVSRAIDEAAEVFANCWKTLVSMKEGRADRNNMQAIANFQHQLAQALVKLDRLYLDLAREKDALIAKKQRLKIEWFKRQMASRSKYQKALTEAIRIGKTVGDNFAWLFYMREPQLIARHLEHPGNLHMPSGIGAIGELAFAANIKPFKDQHIVIYHGTTSFLRIGDVSFVHLPTRTVSALGELKSKEGRTAGKVKQVEITLSLIGDAVQLPRRMPFLPKRSTSRARSRPLTTLPAGREAQLRRQISRMAAALDTDEPDRRIDVRQLTNVLKLQELASRVNTREMSHIKVDDGLAIVGFRLAASRSKLSSRLLPRRFTGDTTRLTASTPEIAMELVDKSRRDNTMVISRVTASFMPGMSPLFWSPLHSDVVEALTFERLYCATWFNPVHLVSKLRQAGMSVTTDAHGIPTAVAKPASTHGMLTARITESTILFITQHLVTEAAFVQMLQRMFDEAEKYAPQNVEICMPIFHYYDEPPPRLPKRHRRLSHRAKPGA